MTNSDGKGATGWTALILSGFVAGMIINVIEWLAHRVWLDAQWNAAFAALGRTPSFWSTFVAANFAVGVVAVWCYRWLAQFYGAGTATALKVAAATWIIFWVIPIAGLQPFHLFPDYLLVLVVLVGVADVLLGVLPAIVLYRRLSRHNRSGQ